MHLLFSQETCLVKYSKDSKNYHFVYLQHNHIPGNFGILYKPLIVDLHKKFDFVPKGYLLPRENEILRAEVSMCCIVVTIVQYTGLTKKNK